MGTSKGLSVVGFKDKQLKTWARLEKETKTV